LQAFVDETQQLALFLRQHFTPLAESRGESSPRQPLICGHFRGGR
jgi:hypothetical protein